MDIVEYLINETRVDKRGFFTLWFGADCTNILARLSDINIFGLIVECDGTVIA